MAIEIAGRYSLIVIPVAACFLSGCATGPIDLSGRTEEEPPPLATGIEVAEVETASQLVAGWHDLEQNTWRWTAVKFAVQLRPPVESQKRGAALEFRFTLPDVEISKRKAVTLFASVRGTQLAPQTYRAAGDKLYTRDVPAALLSGHSVRIDFTVDRPFVPGSGDLRELGVIGRSVRLELK